MGNEIWLDKHGPGGVDGVGAPEFLACYKMDFLNDQPSFRTPHCRECDAWGFDHKPGCEEGKRAAPIKKAKLSGRGFRVQKGSDSMISKNENGCQ